MRTFLRLLPVIFVAFYTALTASAQPVNDQFANAITINGPIATVTGSNVGATKQFGGGGGGEPSIPGAFPGAFGGASVWWNWTSAASGQTTIDTQGSDFNTLLGVFTGSAQNQLTLVAGNDDFEGNSWSRVTFNAVAGTTYRIMVDGFRSGAGFGSPAMGNIRLNVKGVGGLDISLTNGMVFTLGDPIPVSVSFTPDFPNPPATRVDFYRRGSPFTAPVLFASDSTPPFNAVAENVPVGTNTFYVAAFDSLGNPVESPTASVLVQNVGVTLLTPFEDTMYLSAAPITVSAWAFLPAGTITNIEFLVDGVKFAEAATPPYSGVWSNVVGGSHRFTAVGRSDSGARYVSQPVNVGVAASLMPNASVWKYLDDGSDQGTNWYASNFDDGSWASGPAPLGYSDSNGRLPATTNNFGPDANAKFTTTYYRRAFTVNNASSFARINLNIERDDGAVVYLNGTELSRFNMPTGVVTSATFAASNAGDDGSTVFTISVPPERFINGMNVFAVEIHQDSGNSSDIWFQMNLQGIPTIIHNLSPSVSLTNPVAGTFFRAPSEIALAATAADADGSVTLVEFFADGVKVGEDATAPYEAVWSNPPVAAHLLTAVATDEQGATTTSAEIPVVVYDAEGHPVSAITYPADGATMGGPTNLVVTATANAITSITNVVFLANGVEFGHAVTPPYSAVWTAPFGTNILTTIAVDDTGTTGTSPPVTVILTIPPTNVVAPTIAGQSPAAGVSLTNLTSITVTFSEFVQNIDAADLLLNGVPATSVSANHSKSNYTFTFPRPAYGTVNVTWAAGHGIVDYGFPGSLPFDENGTGATWTYELLDQVPPYIALRSPTAGSTVTNLSTISVTFSEPVGGVDAADLFVNGTPALGVSGSGASYTFELPHFSTSLLNVSWSTTNNIFDLAATPNAFNRTFASNTWSFTLDTRYIFIQTNTAWQFVKGTAEASSPTNAWRQLTYDDAGWSNAPAPFFYGETSLTNLSYPGTTLSDMQSNYTSIYLRREFTVENRGNITNLLLYAQVDDGFVAWINGVQMVRANVPLGELPYNAVASAQATEPNNNGASYVVYPLLASASALVDGRNVLAIHAFNQNLTNSSDFSFNAQLYTYLQDPSTVAPRLLTPTPPQGDTFFLTNLIIAFSEPVTGVDATDLLINGVPASSVSSETNTTYSFSFSQPDYGPVLVTWDTNHGIVDFDGPPKAFNGAATNAILNYFLINPSNPTITSQAPVAGSTVTGLTQVVVTFNEPVSGVDAADLLLNGAAAQSVTSADNITYSFAVTQPAYGAVAVRWGTNHGIVDVEAGNAFDPTRFGGQWNYSLVDPVPSVALTSPTNNTFFLPPVSITLRATASDNDGTVALVEFFEGATKLGESSAAPYSLAVSNLGLGVYTFRAVATDNIGLSRASTPVVLNVVTSLPIALVRGPYLNSGSTTGAVVRWRTDVISDAVVYYGTNVNSLTSFAVETSVTNEHIVTLTDLQPDTKYFYSIGSGAYRLVGGTNDGANYWFKTLPPVGTRRPVRFWALGDAGTAGNGDPARQQSTRDAFYNYAASSAPADFMMMLGDNAYNSGTDSEHQAAIFDMYPTTLRNLFLWPTIGNHETAQSTTATDFPYMHIFSLPKNGESGGVPSGTEKYYSLDYANIHFICLDSMTSGQTANTPMANWLRADLEATSQEWIIVFFHHPPYTKGSHNSDTEQDLVAIRQNLMPILEDYGVDLVLSGHSHAYERSFLLKGHFGLSTTITPAMKLDAGDGREDGDGPYRKSSTGEGTVYTVAGSSGQATFATTPDQTFATTNHPAMYFSVLELGTLVVDVSSNRLDARFLRETGVIQDHFTITKPPPFTAAPVNLAALPTGPAEITLSWTPGSGNHRGYSIERSIDGLNFSQWKTAGSDATTLIDSGLTPNATYFYRVRATNSFGISDFSNIASATAVNPTAPPQAPAALAVHADDGVHYFRSQLILSWQDRSTNEAAFQIERSLDGGSYVVAATVGANITRYTDHNLASGTAHYYRVRAVNALGASAPTASAGDVTHPQSQLVVAGSSATFHAGFEGSPSVRYQWRYAGVPLAGKTNETLVLSNVQFNNEGNYSVAITAGDKQTESNPAYLFVLAPPRIVTQLADTAGTAGGTVLMPIGVDGTSPLFFRWRKNGVPLPDVIGPILTLSPAQWNDVGSYDVTVENEFGSVTSRVAQLELYGAPVMSPVPDYRIDVLQPLIVSNSAVDPNQPPLKLVYALGPGAPANATINPTNGVFRWTPTRAQAPSTNYIVARVYDQTRPTVGSALGFQVIVKDYIEVTVGRTNLLTGETNAVPLTLFSSAPLRDARYDINYAGTHLTNLTVDVVTQNVATVALNASNPPSAIVSMTARTGNSLLGTQQLATLRFQAIPGQSSAFTPLEVVSVNFTPVNAGLDPTILVNNGRAVVIGDQPLLEPVLTNLAQRQMTIYGRTGNAYTIEYSTNLADTNGWRVRANISATTVLPRTIPLTSTPPPPVYYRVRR